QVVGIGLVGWLWQRPEVHFPGFLLPGQPFQVRLDEGRTLAELQPGVFFGHAPLTSASLPTSPASWSPRPGIVALADDLIPSGGPRLHGKSAKTADLYRSATVTSSSGASTVSPASPRSPTRRPGE